MKVRLDLIGELDEALPGSLLQAFTLKDGATVADLLQELPFSERVALTSVNSQLVPPTQRADYVLAEGDEVLMIPPVKGG